MANPKIEPNSTVASFDAAMRDSMAQRKEPIEIKQGKRIHIDHVEMANTLVKFIASTPNLNTISKKIMIKKICNPGLTNLAIAIQFKMREHDVDLFEEEGKYVCGQWLKVCTSQEAIDRVNANRIITDEIKNLKAQDTVQGSKLL